MAQKHTRKLPEKEGLVLSLPAQQSGLFTPAEAGLPGPGEWQEPSALPTLPAACKWAAEL